MKSDRQRLMEAIGEGFVRLCRTDDALWVSDLPRKSAAWMERARLLEPMGFTWTLDEKQQLLKLDWTQRRWDEKLAEMPAQLPQMPGEEGRYPLYALCRLWLLHPCRRTEETLPVIRRVLKLTSGPEGPLLHAASDLHAQAARQLRINGKCAFDAGRVLAAWLIQKEEKAC